MARRRKTGCLFTRRSLRNLVNALQQLSWQSWKSCSHAAARAPITAQMHRTPAEELRRLMPVAFMVAVAWKKCKGDAAMLRLSWPAIARYGTQHCHQSMIGLPSHYRLTEAPR